MRRIEFIFKDGPPEKWEIKLQLFALGFGIFAQIVSALVLILKLSGKV